MGNAVISDEHAQAEIEGRTGKSAEVLLAQEINEAFGTRIAAADLKDFLIEKWHRVQVLAHIIHDGHLMEKYNLKHALRRNPLGFMNRKVR